MTNLWVDANVLLRLITNEPLELAERATRLAEQAEQGEVTLKVLPIVVAEIVWVLNSFYKDSRSQIANVLIPLLSADGISLEDHDSVINALGRMSAANVDFMDAYLAEVARRNGEAVVSFDRDFRRLEINWVEPE